MSEVISDDQLITAALKVAESRVSAYAATSKRIDNPESLKNWACLFYAGLDQTREHFTLVCLNTRHGMLSADVVHSGGLDGCEVSIPTVIRAALAKSTCFAVILVHNHPSGNLEPSAADLALTTRLSQAFRLIDIRLLDHLIVNGANAVSLAERGFL